MCQFIVYYSPFYFFFWDSFIIIIINIVYYDLLMFMTPCTLKFFPRINGYGVTDALLISAKSCEIAYMCK